MAKATVFTAERMAAIEAASVVDGDVDADGNLILTKHDGTTFNAGSVKGPTGSPGAQKLDYKPATAAPSTYPTGLSIFTVFSPNVDYPALYGTVVTDYESSTRGYQLFFEKGGTTEPAAFYRTVTTDAWSSWYRIATRDYVDAGVASAKSYSDGLWGGTELAGGIDLNTITTPGVYLQSQSAEAISGVNYPVPSSGYLEVRATPGRGNVWQEYVALNAPDRLYKRAYFSSTGWTAWKTYVSVPDDDVAWTTMTLNTGFAASGGYTPRVRKKNGVIYMDGYITGTFTGAGTSGSTYQTAFTLPSWAWPARPLGFASVGNTAANFSISVQANGQVQLWAEASSAAWISMSNCVWVLG